ncbi:MAG: hypothetical protein QXK89_06105 [Candidatus Bathyarchaeia archaeon]
MFEGELWEIINKVGNLSLVAIAIPALIYYFGRLIGDVRVEKFDKAGYYIEGLFFSLTYIGIPLASILFIEQFVNIRISLKLSLILQFFALCFLVWIFLANELLKRHRISLVKVLERISPDRHIYKDFMETLNEAFYKLMKFSEKYFFLYPFISSLILMWICYSSISFENLSSPLSLFAVILAFLNYTFLALNCGYAGARYPYVKVVLKNGSEIEGRALKFSEFLHIIKENEEKKIFINRDSIVLIEMSLYGEKETNIR